MARTVFANATIVDGCNPARKGSVVISGDVIEAVREGPIAAAPGVRHIDLGGRTVMPGMVLGHYHAAYWNIGGGGIPLGLDAPPALQALRAAANVRTAIECGFTGVISAGVPNRIDVALKTAIAEGIIVGPHIMTGSRDISSTGHSADKSFPSWWEIGAKGAVNRCDGPDAFRRAVREEIKDGAEIVKIFATDGHATGGDGSHWEIGRDEFAAAVLACHERGAKARAHIANRDAILYAIELGVHIIDHGDGFDEACAEASIAANAFLTPSLFFPKVMMGLLGSTPYTDLMKAPYEAMARILPRLNTLGVKLLIGDDYGTQGCPHGRYAEELALYVNEVGIPALDVIRWATRNGAEAMGLLDRTGTLEPGKWADLVVVDGDPLADITILQDQRKILAVFKQGQAIRDDLGTLAPPVGGKLEFAA